jgi:cell division protein FtsL
MRRSVLCAAILLLLSAFSFADDQEKAEKQIRMMTAMSRDDTARSIMSRTFADAFKIDRAQLVAERKSLGLNYGGLFLAHQLTAPGSRIQEIAVQLRGRKSLRDIGGADWKRIAAEAKKMNNRINDSIYKHFLHSKPDEERDKLEHYNPSADLIRADGDATSEEILKAQKEYVFWRNQAAPLSGGQADASTPIGQTYQQTREDIAVTHGNTPPGPR